MRYPRWLICKHGDPVDIKSGQILVNFSFAVVVLDYS